LFRNGARRTREPAGTQAVDVRITEGSIGKTLSTRLMIVNLLPKWRPRVVGSPGTTKLAVRMKNKLASGTQFPAAC